jgi:flagellar basal-body rod protein FlgB
VIDLFSQSASFQTLELSLRFASQRQQILAHNVANITTPNFIPKDVSVDEFRRTLSRAVKDREASPAPTGLLSWRETRELGRGPSGEIVLHPRTPGRGLLFHDRNNRDLERLMQDVAENAGAFRVAADLLRTRFDAIRTAISQRV